MLGIKILSLLLLMLWVSACATTTSYPTNSDVEKQQIVWPEAPEKTRIEYINQFSNARDLGLKEPFSRRFRDLLVGSDEQPMTRPYSVATNEKMIVVADPGLAVVHFFDTSKKSYRRLEQAGEISFSSPIGVAIADDRIFIVDSDLNKVFILDLRFKLLQILENFQRPTALAYDPVGERLYVADTAAHEVQAFNLRGKQLFTIGGRGNQNTEFNFPSHIAFSNDRLLVNDTMNFRIQIFDSNGKHIKTFGKQGTGSGFFVQPKGVAVDTDGHIYVADALANQIQIFNDDGAFLLGFGSQGSGPGQFQMPTGLTIFNDKIYVMDSLNHRVQVFRYLNKEHN